MKLTERHAAFTDLTPAILNEFISRIEVHERDQKRARYAIQHISIYFNYIGRFENEVTQLAEPTEQEIRQMREEIEEAKKEKSRAYHRQYSREYRARYSGSVVKTKIQAFYNEPISVAELGRCPR